MTAASKTTCRVMPAPFIPANREMNTADRLRLVAAILHDHPERHDQTAWYGVAAGGEEWRSLEQIARERGDDAITNDGFLDDLAVIEVASNLASCGSTGCAAGWAVAASPPALLRDVFERVRTQRVTRFGRHVDEWVAAGAKALGLEYLLAQTLFESGNKRTRLIKALRVLAELPPHKRTDKNAELLGIDWDWLEGRGRSRLKCDGKDVNEVLDKLIEKEVKQKRKSGF